MKRSFLVCILGIFFCSQLLLAQSKPKRSWKWDLDAKIDLKYNNNVFRLTDSKIARKELKKISDLVSRRFKHMNSVSDFIVSPKVKLFLKRKSPLGGKVTLIPSFGYNLYYLNSRSSYAESGIEILQTVRKKGRIDIKMDATFGQFMKNYLSWGTDIDKNGNINKAERIYSAGIYNEYELMSSYRHQITRRDKKSEHFIKAPGISIEPLLGLSRRHYNQPFSNHSRNGLEIGAELSLDLSRYFDLEYNYSFLMLRSPNKVELVLRDETAFGFNMDLNNDADINNAHAPVMTKIDRSRDQHNMGGSLIIIPAKKLKIYVKFEIQNLTYRSTNYLDTYHFALIKNRDEFELGIRWKFQKRWKASFEYERTNYVTYTRSTVKGQIKHRF